MYGEQRSFDLYDFKLFLYSYFHTEGHYHLTQRNIHSNGRCRCHTQSSLRIYPVQRLPRLSHHRRLLPRPRLRRAPHHPHNHVLRPPPRRQARQERLRQRQSHGLGSDIQRSRCHTHRLPAPRIELEEELVVHQEQLARALALFPPFDLTVPPSRRRPGAEHDDHAAHTGEQDERSEEGTEHGKHQDLLAAGRQVRSDIANGIGSHDVLDHDGARGLAAGRALHRIHGSSERCGSAEQSAGEWPAEVIACFILFSLFAQRSVERYCILPWHGVSVSPVRLEEINMIADHHSLLMLCICICDCNQVLHLYTVGPVVFDCDRGLQDCRGRCPQPPFAERQICAPDVT